MRIRMLNLLAVERRPMAVGEIVENLPIGQSTVSHHLKILAEVGFVPAETRGTSTRYAVNDKFASAFGVIVPACCRL